MSGGPRTRALDQGIVKESAGRPPDWPRAERDWQIRKYLSSVVPSAGSSRVGISLGSLSVLRN